MRGQDGPGRHLGSIRIIPVVAVTDALVAAFERLVPQLSRSASPPTSAQLHEIISSPVSTLLIAQDLDNLDTIVGALTLIVFRIPTGVRAWIEDVVVDESFQGRGIGEALNRAALELARGAGAKTVELTSRPSREIANRLYKRMGFVLRETNVYRFDYSA